MSESLTGWERAFQDSKEHTVMLQPAGIFDAQWQHMAAERNELLLRLKERDEELLRLRRIVLAYRRVCARCCAVAGPCGICKEVIGMIREAMKIENGDDDNVLATQHESGDESRGLESGAG